MLFHSIRRNINAASFFPIAVTTASICLSSFKPWLAAYSFFSGPISPLNNLQVFTLACLTGNRCNLEIYFIFEGNCFKDEDRRQLDIKAVVLVVDADPASRVQTSDLIERCGCLAETAEDGVQAIEIFKRIEPDIVILCAELPGVDGYALCAEIRRLPQGKHTKILIITGAGEADARSSYEAGASDFIAKPAGAFNHRVMHILRDVCSRQELHRTQDMHREIVDASPHLLLRIGRDGTILERRSPASFNFGCFADALPGCRYR